MPEGAGAATSEGADLARRVHRRLWAHGILAHGFVGVLASVIYLVVAPFNFGPRGTAAISQILPFAWAFFVAAAAVEYFRSRYPFRPVRAWLIDERAPTPSEWHATLAQARRQALLTAPYWLVIIAVALTYFVVWSDVQSTMSERIRATASGLVVMLNGCILVYLLVDRAMRPVLARANALDPSLAPGGLGLSSRLALALVAVAGTPMSGIINSFVAATPQEIERSGVVAQWAAAARWPWR